MDALERQLLSFATPVSPSVYVKTTVSCFILDCGEDKIYRRHARRNVFYFSRFVFHICGTCSMVEINGKYIQNFCRETL